MGNNVFRTISVKEALVLIKYYKWEKTAWSHNAPDVIYIQDILRAEINNRYITGAKLIITLKTENGENLFVIYEPVSKNPPETEYSFMTGNSFRTQHFFADNLTDAVEKAVALYKKYSKQEKENAGALLPIYCYATKKQDLMSKWHGLSKYHKKYFYELMKKINL